jgi:LysM repeat protein
MRSLVLFLALVGIGYGALRYFGVLGKEDPVETVGELGSEGDGGAVPLETPPLAPSEPGRTLPAELSTAATELAAGRPLGELQSKLAERAGATEPDADLAKRLLAVASENEKERWLAASACAGDPRLALETRDAFAVRAAQLSKAGVLASSTARYRVVKGDSLEKICKKLAKENSLPVTPGMLRWLNGISGDRIKPDQELTLPPGGLRLVVSKSRFRLDAWMGEGIVRSYRVAIGRDEKTPVATFKVTEKLEKPPWDDPSTGNRIHFGEPGYALGTRWIAFDTVAGHAGLGIHGTDEPSSIGTKASLGCVRLANDEVEDLYALLPIGTVVEIQG